MYDNHIIKDRLNSKKGVVFQPPSKKPEDFVSLYEKIFHQSRGLHLFRLCPIPCLTKTNPTLRVATNKIL